MILFFLCTAVDNGCVAYVLRTGFYTSQVRQLAKCFIQTSNLKVCFNNLSVNLWEFPDCVLKFGFRGNCYGQSCLV